MKSSRTIRVDFRFGKAALEKVETSPDGAPTTRGCGVEVRSSRVGAGGGREDAGGG